MSRVCIRSDYVGYKVTFSPEVSGWRGFSVNVEDISEIATVLEHWFTGHGQREDCAVCTHVKRNLKKKDHETA